ncbi:hypothetical protein PtrSN002B_005715 [Pyrenophora tritici-repentis]|uniref:Uncharacterized protein n=1 Tax=Pyrenophora tritici-repentis TaxID=45151 RepID=A0A2W1FZM0_9PLEO|nr:hypothetical protein PtrV1_11150 [Pyrenophora tritici-repentis]KAF7443662.1 hypothetical protein A1F99_117360 [Pyrenophora tritici-repentis]KAF7566619.1 hypothetical protein PtrM4_149390 [Pyrenophora tritici-repentis]KAI0577830.1 hypothetical protein Alg215_06691 [Pyrenophora tritici-repentis]KAI1547461.1 hypothetical protein PtrSN001A_001584 [Pyrenophora tritici-repentis]
MKFIVIALLVVTFTIEVLAADCFKIPFQCTVDDNFGKDNKKDKKKHKPHIEEEELDAMPSEVRKDVIKAIADYNANPGAKITLSKAVADYVAKIDPKVARRQLVNPVDDSKYWLSIDTPEEYVRLMNGARHNWGWGSVKKAITNSAAKIAPRQMNIPANERLFWVDMDTPDKWRQTLHKKCPNWGGYTGPWGTDAEYSKILALNCNGWNGRPDIPDSAHPTITLPSCISSKDSSQEFFQEEPYFMKFITPDGFRQLLALQCNGWDGRPGKRVSIREYEHMFFEKCNGWTGHPAIGNKARSEQQEDEDVVVLQDGEGERECEEGDEHCFNVSVTTQPALLT